MGLNYFYSLHLLLKPVPPFHVVKTILTVSRPMGCYMAYTPAVCDSSLNIYIYTPKPGRSPSRQYSVLSCFFPSRPASDFFLDFKKHLLLAVPANQVHQAEKHLKG